MSNLKNSPCRVCTNREVGCHDGCKKYQDWRKKREECKKQERAKNIIPDFK